jgi:para-aminobenzoate synthetase/4-amino-4-deoxychorismate lyase
VTIRTLTLHQRTDGAGCDGRMGVGAGIVIDSRAEAEFEECALKARFLTGLDPGFNLFESMYATREEGIRHVERHLARLAASAAALDFACPRAGIVAALRQQMTGLAPDVQTRIRLALHKDGRFDIVVAPLEPLPPGSAEVLLAPEPVSDPHGLFAHKTTLRTRYDAGIRAAQARGAFDTLFFDADGWLTEGGRSNAFLLIDGQWLTPPVGRGGVLPGTMRAAVLDDAEWSAREQALRVEDLFRAERIVLTNALRGVLEARLAPGEAERWRASLSISATELRDTGEVVQTANPAPSAPASGRSGQLGPEPARAVRD